MLYRNIHFKQSGSVIGPMLLDALMEKDIPVIAVIVGDSSDALKCRNNQSVLSTLSKKAVAKGKCLLTYYINNADMDGNITQSELAANTKIQHAMTIMSLFLSGVNEALDSTDIRLFINQHEYHGITVPAGIYTVSFHAGDKIQLPDYAVPSVARTLTIGNDEVAFTLPVLHHKHGKIVNEEAIKLFTGKVPIHIVASNGLLKEEVRKLTEYNQAAAKRQQDLKNCNLESAEHAVHDDDLDMDF